MNLRVAVGQFPASNDILENQTYIADLVKKAADQHAKLLVLPEASMCSFASSLPELQKMASEHTANFIAFIQEQARHYGLYIVVGVLNASEEEHDERVSNLLMVFNDKGEKICTYQKIHLYDAFNFKESDKVKPSPLGAEALGVFSIGEFTIGLLNCYDLRFPELARALMDQGVNVLSVSANWLAGAYKEMHWELLLRARAIENTSYVLASGQSAPKGIGQSMVIDPMGAILSACADPVGIQVQDISIARLDHVRALLPCLANRRLSSMMFD